MFTLIFSLFFTSNIASADTLSCDKTTAVSKAGALTDQPFKVGADEYIIRKGPNFCYIDAKRGYDYFMLEACDSIVTNTKLLEVSCMQAGKKVTFGREKLRTLRKNKEAALDDDFCNEYLGNERPRLPNDRDDDPDSDIPAGQRAHFPTKPLNGNLMIGESHVKGGKCTLKHYGKSETLECDEIYKNEKFSGNKLICVHGYTAREMIGTLSDGTMIDIDDLLDSELNLCNQTGRISFNDLTSDKLGKTDHIEIQNCQLVSGGDDRNCKRILLTATALVCEPLNNHDLPVEIRKINPTARLEIFAKFFDGEKIPVRVIRDFMQKGLFLPKDKKRFEAELLQGTPTIRDAQRKTSY